jgi:hypothetical protein
VPRQANARPGGHTGTGGQNETGTSISIEDTAPARQEPPELSEFGRRILADAAERDCRLVAELGVGMAEIRDFAEALDPDAFDQLLADAVRWRQMQSSASRAISAAIDWRQQAQHPSHAELQRRRAVDPRRPCSWPGCGRTNVGEHSHQPTGEQKEAS